MEAKKEEKKEVLNYEKLSSRDLVNMYIGKDSKIKLAIYSELCKRAESKEGKAALLKEKVAVLPCSYAEVAKREAKTIQEKTKQGYVSNCYGHTKEKSFLMEN